MTDQTKVETEKGKCGAFSAPLLPSVGKKRWHLFFIDTNVTPIRFVCLKAQTNWQINFIECWLLIKSNINFV